jgi:hypothetical protein
MEVNLTAADGYRVFFRERFRASLWRETVDWLERQ